MTVRSVIHFFCLVYLFCMFISSGVSPKYQNESEILKNAGRDAFERALRDRNRVIVKISTT